MRRRTWNASILVMITCAIGIHPARSELIYFRDGGRLQAPIDRQGDQVRIDVPGGIRSFPRSDFEKIVDGHSPSKEWLTRSSQALKGTEVDQRDAAVWAVEQGLSFEALEFLTSIKTDPTFPGLKRLVTMAQRLNVALAEPSIQETLSALRGSFQSTRGRWVLLLHQHSDAEAIERLEVLERVVVAYYLFWTDLGLDLQVPDKLLITAWFAQQPSYLAFLDREKASAFRGTKGYYHPARGLVVAYDTRGDDIHVQTLQVIKGLRDQLAKLDDALIHLPRNGRVKFQRTDEAVRTLDRNGLTKQRDRLSSEIERRQLLLDLQWRDVELGTAAHEMAHLLIVKSGLAPRFEAFPQWLHEGLATQFENIAGGRWAGIGHPHDLRLPDYRTITPSPHLSSLLRDVGLDQGYNRDAYAAVWSFVNWLLAHRRDQFVTYIEQIRAAGVPARSRPDLLRKVSGQDLPDLEAAWHLSVHAQKTPLEQETPHRTALDRR